MRKRDDFIRINSKSGIYWVINGVALSCSATSFRSKERAEADVKMVFSVRDSTDTFWNDMIKRFSYPHPYPGTFSSSLDEPV